jgi:hypothetical protein
MRFNEANWLRSDRYTQIQSMLNSGMCAEDECCADKQLVANILLGR